MLGGKRSLRRAGPPARDLDQFNARSDLDPKIGWYIRSIFWPYLVGISLKNRPFICLLYMIGTSNESVPEMAIDLLEQFEYHL